MYDKTMEAKAAVAFDGPMRDPESNVPDMLDRLEKSQAELQHLIEMVGDKFRLVCHDTVEHEADRLAQVEPNRAHVTRALIEAVRRNGQMVRQLQGILDSAEL
jgi:hypothetical protein